MKTIFTTLCAILIAIPHAKSSEGRIEISQSMIPLTITNSESYIVTQPLSGKNGQNGIIIAADNVTIDRSSCFWPIQYCESIAKQEA